MTEQKAPLSNADFRRLLQTPVVRAAASQPSSNVGGDGGGAEGRGADGEKKKKKKFYKPKAKDKKPEAPRYRDRAAERRAEGEEGVGEEEASVPAAVAEEESKFLGGDAEHTHLVRGLDVALLERSKREHEARLREAFGPEEDEQGSVAPDEVDSLANRVLRVLGEGTGQPSSVAGTLFAPGRMAWLFDLDRDAEVPTTQLRSIPAAAAAPRRSALVVPTTLIDEIATVLTYGGAGGSRRRSAPTPAKVAAAAATEPVVTLEDVAAAKKRRSEDNIFSESSSGGEEEPTKKAKLEQKDVPAVAKGSYFASTGGSGPATFDPLSSVIGVSSSKVEAAAKALARQKEVEKRRADEQRTRSQESAQRVSAASGAYGAYFQRTVIAPAAPSKDEIDPEEEKKRTRFVVDEGDEVDDAKLLESYRANVETVGDAGKSKKKQRKQNKAKMKLDQQLEKIDKIVEKKQKDAGDN